MPHTYTGQATFTVPDWVEETYFEKEGHPSLSRARSKNIYSGGFIGEGNAEILIIRYSNGSAEFTGHERITCMMDGKKGSFILRHDGTIEQLDGVQVASAACFVVADSATGDLAQMTGAGHFTAEPEGAVLMFELEA